MAVQGGRAALTADTPARVGGCCTKVSEKLWNLEGGRRNAIRRPGDSLVPFGCVNRAFRTWVAPSQIDEPDLWVVYATASSERGSGEMSV